MHDSVCISGCIWHHFKIWYLTFNPSRIFMIPFVYKYYVVEVHLLTHFHNNSSGIECSIVSMFHLTWSTFRFSRNQLGTVSAYVMSSKPWSNLCAH